MKILFTKSWRAHLSWTAIEVQLTDIISVVNQKEDIILSRRANESFLGYVFYRDMVHKSAIIFQMPVGMSYTVCIRIT